MRLPGLERASPRLDRAREVVRMNGVRGGPIFQFFMALAEIIQDLLIDEFDFAFRRQSTNKAGNTIDDQAKTLFAYTQARLGMLERVEVQRGVHRQHYLVR